MSFMKLLPVIAAACALGLGACASLPHRDRSFLQQHAVGGPLYEKMLHQEPLELADIVDLSRRGLPPPFVIHYLRGTYFVYNLKTEDVLELRRAGVAREVIDYLLATPGLYAPGIAPLYPYGPYDYGYGYYYGPPPYFYPRDRFHRW
jgi:hypothetical protein